MNSAIYAPGVLVRHGACPEWGVGQIQSVDGSRITVTFENAGLIVVNSDRVTLQVVNERESRA